MRQKLLVVLILLVSLLGWRACNQREERDTLERQEIPAPAAPEVAPAILSEAEVETTRTVPSEPTALPLEPPITDEEVSASTSPSLHGQVRDDSGAVVPGCRVVLRNGGVERSQVAGDLGEFRFTEVAPGEAKLHVSSSATLACFPTPNPHDCGSDELPWYGATCLEFKSTNSSPVLLVLRRAAFLEGRVIDAFGTPLPGAIVELLKKGVGFRSLHPDLELTGEDGRFSARVFPGRTSLKTFTSPGAALSGSGRPPERDFVLAPGETYDVGDLIIGGGGVKLTGRVVDQEGYGAEHVLVRARLIGAVQWMETETRGAGVFAFDGVYPGRYQIQVAPAGARPTSPARFLKKAHPTHEVEVTGEGGHHAVGNFQLEFDDSYHFYGRLEFAPESTVVKENLRVFAVPIGSGVQSTEPVYFTSFDEFAWHVRDPSLYSEVSIEVRQIDPETMEIVETYAQSCHPTAQTRERREFLIP